MNNLIYLIQLQVHKITFIFIKLINYYFFFIKKWILGKGDEPY